jgi:PAS domain-containing protein
LSAPDREVVLLNLDEVVIAVGYFDAEERCVFVNPVAARWMRSSPDALRGRSVREILGEELYRERLPYVSAVLNGVPQEFEGVVRYPDGIARRVCMTLSPDRRHGRVVGYFVSTVRADLIGEDTPVRALHDALVAALIEQGLAEPRSADEARIDDEARIEALLDSVRDRLADIRRQLGIT